MDQKGIPRVLFLCSGNSCRSQMAEGWTRELQSGRFEAYSAGVTAKGLDPRAVRAMAEVGIDISGQWSKTVDDLPDGDFDFVVTVCDHAREACPFFPAKTKLIHFGFDDPPALAESAADEEEAMKPYRRVRDEIETFVKNLTHIWRRLVKDWWRTGRPGSIILGRKNDRIGMNARGNSSVSIFRKLGLVYAAGGLGGLINSVALWACGEFGLTAALNIKIAPDLTPAWLYPRLVWGGIWGLLFVLPGFGGSWLKRGLVFSLGPTLVQLLVIFPFQAHKDWFGLDLGSLTPALVLVMNALWGLGAALFLRISRE